MSVYEIDCYWFIILFLSDSMSACVLIYEEEIGELDSLYCPVSSGSNLCR
jgi:hypothetical protein